MRGCIAEIRKPWKRRTVLCAVIVPAGLVYAVLEIIEVLIKIRRDVVVTFKDMWKED